MGEAAKLQGSKLIDLFKEMVEKKVIISMNVKGADFERLTCITGWTESDTGKYLYIDQPDDFKEVAAEKNLWRLQFNFNGPDQLEYFFDTDSGELCSQGLKIPFPRYVERLQRRRNFRVDSMTGSELHFNLNKIHGIIHLANVSQGGAYGILVKHNFKFIRGSLLKLGQQVEDLRMLFPGDKQNNEPGETIYIKKAKVRRVEYDEERGIYRYAFEFKEMEKEEQDRLIRIIYDLQRKYLRRR